MARKPKLFLTVKSTNLLPSDSVNYRIHASTHHWRGELLENGYASASLLYGNVQQTENALQYVADEFVHMQDSREPARDIELQFPERYYHAPSILTNEQRDYYAAVRAATAKGWCWEEALEQDILTGERKPVTYRLNLSLSTWQWAQHNLGSSVQFTHFQGENETRAELLTRILKTAEKAKHDYRFSIPRQSVSGKVVTDELATENVFGRLNTPNRN